MPAVTASAASVRSGSLATLLDEASAASRRRSRRCRAARCRRRPQQLAQRPVGEAVAVGQAAAGVHARLGDRRRVRGAGTPRRAATYRRRPRRGSRPCAARPSSTTVRWTASSSASSWSRPTNEVARDVPGHAQRPRLERGARARVLDLVLRQARGQLVDEHARGRRAVQRPGACASTSPSGSPALTSTSPVATAARPAERERGADGALGVVLVRARDAEHRHHRPAVLGRHGAVEPLDLVACALRVLALEGGDGDELALVARRARGSLLLPSPAVSSRSCTPGRRRRAMVPSSSRRRTRRSS